MNSETPFLKQYRSLKAQVPDALLLFRMGDFYELFEEDAIFASQVLDLTLTSRDKNKADALPMAGFPHSQLDQYIPRLLKAGRKVAIGEQLEAASANRMVRREIVRVLTPGVHFEGDGLEAPYLGVCLPEEGSSETFCLACIESSTGELWVQTGLSSASVTELLSRWPLRHLLFWEGQKLPPFPPNASILKEPLPLNRLALEQAERLLQQLYGVQQLGVFFETRRAIVATGLLVTYLMKTQQQSELRYLKRPQPFHPPDALLLGPNTPQHLDLPELIKVLEKELSCIRTALGSRQLRRWVLHQGFTKPEPIHRRQAAIRALAHLPHRGGWTHRLSQIADLERLCSRLETGVGGPKETLALGKSLALLPALQAPLDDLDLQPWKTGLEALFPALLPLAERILRIQQDPPPAHAREGGIFRKGTSPELDHLLDLTEGGQQQLADLEARERARTQIPSLKVGYNRVFGYFIEITQSHLKSKTLPSDYQRKQTRIGAERFVTEELKHFEEALLQATAQQQALEASLFQQLLRAVQQEIPNIMKAAHLLGELDALACFAELSLQPGWIFPTLDEGLSLTVVAGQHPILVSRLRGRFVPNSAHLDPASGLTWILTGPNMGGKSTFMRQMALLVLLGQIGAPIPAQEARWGVFSSIYTRIGAQDAILQGQSTFMVEMSELATLLHQGNERSLVLLDEIGRGTSTYDGISLAGATLRWLVTHLRCRTFFATHYHELIHLAQNAPGLVCMHVAVEQSAEHPLRFLYQIQPGPTQESFGIQVAELAGLPKPVIEEAWAQLEQLERTAASPVVASGSLPSPWQSLGESLLKVIDSVDILHLTPLQALQWIENLQAEKKRLCKTFSL